MAFVDRYPPTLDRRAEHDTDLAADEAVYRLAWKRLPLAGLPDEVQIGDVDLYFTVGPIRTQRTAIRQRHAWPPVFDKRMQRALSIGDGELLTVCELTGQSVDHVASSVEGWRQRVLNAVGFLTAVVDERVALGVVAEDVVLLHRGRSVAAVDVRRAVRTFMPFDVTEDDRRALKELRRARPEGQVGRAAHLMALGSRSGRSPEGYLFLWLAIDGLVGARKTQKTAVAAALADAGVDLEWLSLPLGRLVGLRGDLAHGRPTAPDLLNSGYYDSEAIARLLVRRAIGVAGGWPALLTPTAFPLPLGRRIAEERANWSEDWHEGQLPAADPTPARLGYARVDALLGDHDQWLIVHGAPNPEVEGRVRFWTLAAVNAADVDVEPFEVHIGSSQLPPGLEWAVNAERILVATEAAAGPDDPGEPRMAWQLCRLVAEMQVMRTGVTTGSLGGLLIDLGGTWVAYHEWVIGNELPVEFLTRVPLTGATWPDIGATIGCALAGDEQARVDVDQWLAEPPDGTGIRQVVAELLPVLEQVEHFSDYLTLTTVLIKSQSGLEPEGP